MKLRRYILTTILFLILAITFPLPSPVKANSTSNQSSFDIEVVKPPFEQSYESKVLFELERPEGVSPIDFMFAIRGITPNEEFIFKTNDGEFFFMNKSGEITRQFDDFINVKKPASIYSNNSGFYFVIQNRGKIIKIFNSDWKLITIKNVGEWEGKLLIKKGNQLYSHNQKKLAEIQQIPSDTSPHKRYFPFEYVDVTSYQLVNESTNTVEQNPISIAGRRIIDFEKKLYFSQKIDFYSIYTIDKNLNLYILGENVINGNNSKYSLLKISPTGELLTVIDLVNDSKFNGTTLNPQIYVSEEGGIYQINWLGDKVRLLKYVK